MGCCRNFASDGAPVSPTLHLKPLVIAVCVIMSWVSFGVGRATPAGARETLAVQCASFARKRRRTRTLSASSFATTAVRARSLRSSARMRSTCAFASVAGRPLRTRARRSIAPRTRQIGDAAAKRRRRLVSGGQRGRGQHGGRPEGAGSSLRKSQRRSEAAPRCNALRVRCQ